MSCNIHPLSDVQSTTIGEHTSVWQFCVILPGARIGKNCNINAHCFIENDVTIGDNVTIKCGVSVWDGLVIENNVLIGPNVSFTNNPYPRSKRYLKSPEKIYINRGASIGAQSVVCSGITIGSYALIGAGSVVTKNVPDFNLWYGNPAILHGHVCVCGRRIEISDHKCKFCNASFVWKEGNPVLQIFNQ